jgi:hypothetical protein
MSQRDTVGHANFRDRFSASIKPAREDSEAGGITVGKVVLLPADAPTKVLASPMGPGHGRKICGLLARISAWWTWRPDVKVLASKEP